MRHGREDGPRNRGNEEIHVKDSVRLEYQDTAGLKVTEHA